MKKSVLCVIAAIIVSLVTSSSAFAIGATLIFKSGLRVFVNNGYDKIVDSLSSIDGEARHRIVSLDVEGGIFLLDVAEVVIVCKDRCTSIDIVDPRANKGQQVIGGR